MFELLLVVLLAVVMVVDGPSRRPAAASKRETSVPQVPSIQTPVVTLACIPPEKSPSPHQSLVCRVNRLADR